MKGITLIRRLLLGLFALAEIAALIGFLTPWTVPGFLLPLSTLTMLGVALLHAGARYGWPRAVLFWGLTTLLTLLLEAVGVATGWIYGPYHYTSRLGPRFLGLVPYLIPAAWFMALYPATVVAEGALPRHWPSRRQRWLLPLLAGMVMTAWDLVMDPMMVAHQHWIWETPGGYFGIPLHNFAGWWLTTALVVGSFLLLAKPPVPNPHPDDREAVLAYGLIGLGNVLHAAALGLPGPALVGLFAITPWVWLGWWGLQRPTPRTQQG